MSILVKVNTASTNAWVYNQLLKDWGVPVMGQWQEGSTIVFRIPEGYAYPNPSNYRGVSPDQYSSALSAGEKKRQADLKAEQDFIKANPMGGSVPGGYTSDLNAYYQQKAQESQDTQISANRTMIIKPSQTYSIPRTLVMEGTGPQYAQFTEVPDLTSFTKDYQAERNAGIFDFMPRTSTAIINPYYLNPKPTEALRSFSELRGMESRPANEQAVYAGIFSVPVGGVPVGYTGLYGLNIASRTPDFLAGQAAKGINPISSLAYGSIKAGIMAARSPFDWAANIPNQDWRITTAQLLGGFSGSIKSAGSWGYSKIMGRNPSISYSYGVGKGAIYSFEREPVSFGQSADIYVTIGKNKPMTFKANMNAYFLTEELAGKQTKSFGKSFMEVREYPDVLRTVTIEKGMKGWSFEMESMRKPPIAKVNAVTMGRTFDIGTAPDILFREYQRGKTVTTAGSKTSTSYFQTHSGIERMFKMDYVYPQMKETFLGRMDTISQARYHTGTDTLMISKYRVPRLSADIIMGYKKTSRNLIKPSEVLKIELAEGRLKSVTEKVSEGAWGQYYPEWWPKSDHLPESIAISKNMKYPQKFFYTMENLPKIIRDVPKALKNEYGAWRIPNYERVAAHELVHHYSAENVLRNPRQYALNNEIIERMTERSAGRYRYGFPTNLEIIYRKDLLKGDYSITGKSLKPLESYEIKYVPIKKVNIKINRYGIESAQTTIGRYDVYGLSPDNFRKMTEPFKKANLGSGRNILADMQQYYRQQSAVKSMESLKGASLKAAESPMKKAYGKQFAPSKAEATSGISGGMASMFGRSRYEYEAVYSAKSMPRMESMKFGPEFRVARMKVSLATQDSSSKSIQKQIERMAKDFGQRNKTVQSPLSIQIPKQSQKNILSLRSAQAGRQELKQLQILRIAETPRRPTPFPFGFSMPKPPKGFPNISSGKSTMKYPNPFKGKGNYTYKYTPSVAGIDLGLKAYRIPKRLTGLEIRPVVINGGTGFSISATRKRRTPRRAKNRNRGRG